MIITEQDFDKALAVLEATEKKMPLAFSGVGRAANVDLLVKVMSEITIKKEASFNELMARFYMDADKFTLTKVMETLESMDFVRFKRGKFAHTGKDCGPLLV